MKITRNLFLKGSLALAASAILGNLSSSEGAVMMQRIINLRDIVGPDVYQRAGLHKLSENEQMALADWINDYMNQLTKSVEENCRKSQVK